MASRRPLTAYELARRLLDLPDNKVIVVTKVDQSFVEEKYVVSSPWLDADGNVRIQPMFLEDGDD